MRSLCRREMNRRIVRGLAVILAVICASTASTTRTTTAATTTTEATTTVGTKTTTTDIAEEGLKCQDDHFLCVDGKKCIPLRWKCDYVPDCPDGSDEPDSCAPRTCSPGQFQCAIAQKCIPLGWVCDGEPDCSFGQVIQDTSDEDARRCGKGNACPQNYFRCKDNITCKPISMLCDNKNDCPDWSDEAPFCHNKTMCDGVQCEYKCRPSLLGPLCYCGEGKEPNGTQCIDTDECKLEGTCDQTCVNTEGSHDCSCVSGYVQEGSQCFANNVPDKLPASIIFSNAKDIQHVYLNGTLVPGESITLHPDAFALDFDHRNESVCWVNVVLNKSILKCGPIHNLSNTWDIIPSSTLHLGTATQLALDWVSGNWYFLDDEREIIFVCNHTLVVCITIVDVGLSKPRGIALDPTKGLMFFTEWGTSAPLLERARMDGSDRKTLVHYKIVYPYGLAVDYPNEHVYWVDTYLDYIERVDYNGVRRITVIKGTPVQNLYGITVFEQNLYVTSWREHSIVRVNKYNQSDYNTIRSNLSRPFAIHIYHRQRQPDVNHSCVVNNGNCEHICITLWKNTKPIVQCLCKPGFILKNNRCSGAKKEQFLLFGQARPGMIKGIAIGPGDKVQEVMEPIMDLTRPTALDYDVSTQYIYYSDIQRFVIERRKIEGGQPEKVIDQGLNGCEGLAIDWMGKNIYWTDEALNSIFVARLSDTSVKKLLVYGNMTHPRSIVVHPKSGYMYWTDWSVGQNFGMELANQGKIERAWMDGSNRQVLISSKLRWPNGLTIDYTEKKLYFCDTYLHKIEKSNLDGTDREVFLEGDSLEHPYSLAYYMGFVYWSEFQKGRIQRASAATKKIETLRVENPPVFELLLFNNASQTGSNPCSAEKKCEDLCLAIPVTPHYTCSCRDGFAVSDDKSACEYAENYTDPTSCKESEFRCNKTHRCIDRRFLCDGDNDCVDGSDEDSSDGGSCEKVTCNADNIKCDKNRCISVHWVCDGDRDCVDGSDESPAICKNNTCSATQFTCKVTGRCIPTSWTCDLDNDCGEGDNSDEHEECNYPTCDKTEFQCENKRCIPLEYVCDTDDDCRDDSDERSCPNTCVGAQHFHCASDHSCVPDYVRCNSVWDCYDGSDEVNCTSRKTPVTGACHENEFQCGDGSCIWKAWQCDLMPDCPDSSDEVDCVNVTCGPQEMMCEDRSRCIYRGFVCDGASDCHDGSDERHCSSSTPSCPFPRHSCDDGRRCINITSVCDEKADCEDGSDEGLLCAEKMCGYGECSELCQNTPDGFMCYCHPQRRLLDDKRSCGDASPCSTWGICSQLCTQLKNSHKCDCLPEYELEVDRFTCKSKNSTAPMIIFSNRHELRAVDLNTLSVRALISGLKNTIALDFYYSKDSIMIFWTDVVDDKIYRGTLVGGSLNNIEVVVQTGLATAEGLAVDWIGQNLYWVESNLDQIEVAKLNGSFRRTLIAGDMESPRAIALDPRYGLMFWTDWDSEAPRIESSSMSGEGRRVVFRVDNMTDGAWPNGLTLDYVALRVYWIDAKSDSIHTAKYDGGDHREVTRGNEFLTHPFAIALFGSHVYWTDWRINSVVGANKWNGSDTVVIQRTITQPFDIQVLHPSRQPRDIKNPCGEANGGCTHLCLLSFKNTYSCHCPHVMKLSDDNRTCVSNEKVFLFSRHNEIRGIDLDMPYHHIIPPLSIPQVVSASQIDFDAVERKIYWTDSQLNEVKSASLNGATVETIIDTAIAHPNGFGIDWISRNMYIVSQDAERSSILVCKLHGEYLTRIIDTDIFVPKSLAVNPLTGKLYWSEHGTAQHAIKEASMDGTNERTIVSQRDDERLNAPSSLTMDINKNRLYWVNVDSRTIQYYDFALNDVVTLPIDSHRSQPRAITLDGENLYYADHANKSIIVIDKTTGGNRRLMRNNTADVLALKIYDIHAQIGSNPCSLNNGGCAHLCLPKSSDSRSCRCAIGFVPNSKDSTQCTGMVSFVLYSNKLELRGISLDPKNVNAEVLAPVSKVSLASAIDYVAVLDYIYWVDSEIGSITRIRRDGTGREVIVHGLDSVEGIAIDWIAGNIYWSDRSLDVIEVARLNGTSRYVVVAGGMDKPGALAVHPGLGFLFWTHLGNPAKIERSGLDGGSRVVIVNSSIQSVGDLSIDYVDRKLYWCDSRLDVIERVDFDGSNRETVLQGPNMSPIAISLLGDYLFWIDTVLDFGSVLKADKNNATNYDILRRGAGDVLQDIVVFDLTRQTGENLCSRKNGDCQELCFYLGSENRTCACAHGKVGADGFSCEDYDAFIMYSRVSRIDSIHMFDKNVPNAPFKSIQDPEHMRNVIGLTFDYEQQRLFYSDIQRGSISSVHFNGTGHRVVVEKQGSVEGLAYERVHQELYWTCNSDATISRISLNVRKAQIAKIVQLGTDDKPRGIAVDSCDSRMYWTNWNSRHPSIQRSYLSGYEMESIITTDIRMPNALTIDHRAQKLFWSDARFDKIERCNLDGTMRHVILTTQPHHPFDIAVYEENIFWTDWVLHAVLRANKYTGADVVSLRNNVPRPMGIVAVAKDADDCTVNPCHSLNGGCQDVCGVDENGTVSCSCYPGRVVLTDGKRCAVKTANCSELEFICPSGVCVPYHLTCDGVSECPDDSDESPTYCASRTCRSGYFKCSNNRCMPVERVCNENNDCGDWSDELVCNCTETQFRCASGMCISQEFRCDSDADCGDASDEMGCPPRDCMTSVVEGTSMLHQMTLINCLRTTACIHQDWICDGQNDCWDNSDEENCEATTSSTTGLATSCPDNTHRCQNGRCIPMSWVCDRDQDCGDATNTTASSDEENCNYTCAADKFQCTNLACIPKTWQCDGLPDCTDRSDETEDCQTRQCSENEFRCNKTGQCIPMTWVCDGENDCPDDEASDEHPEQGCLAQRCPEDSFQCQNYRCIYKGFYCDRDDDCGDKSDEPTTCVYQPCSSDQFQCKNKVACIPTTWLCNHINECGDNSDEDETMCQKNDTSKCGSGRYECANGVCVEDDLTCDGENDCGDYSDEERCNINECDSPIACSQVCEDKHIGYQCSCHDGHRLKADGKTCEDVNECREQLPCSHFCHNRWGRYSCSCAPGYISQDDGRSCKLNSTVAPALIFSNRYYIRQMDFSGHETLLLAHNLTNAVALDYDWLEKCIYWSDVTALGSSLKRMCEGQGGHKVLHSATVQNPDGLAVDWIGRNLFWCDKGTDTIEVSKLDGQFRKILIRDGLQEPRAIVVDPFGGYLYWTDWGDRPYIAKVGMDGSQRKVIVNETLGWPNALTISYVTQQLFWADAREDYIAMTNLEGQERHVIVSRGATHPLHHIFSLAVFEDYIFWTDWETKSVERCLKYDCKDPQRIVTTVHRPMSIHVYHPERQRQLPDAENPCVNNSNCQTLCLIQPGGKTSVCGCPENYYLSNDGVSCVSNCTSTQFVCSTTYKCIPFWWRCDTQDDCGDGSDEPSSCPAFHCTPGQFQCRNGTCIHPSQICDGSSQCRDGSDERNCEEYPCLSSQFKCAGNGTVTARCIPASGRCDGQIDCPNKEDEGDCPPRTCQPNHFTCNNGKCVPNVWVCDNDDDCGDKSDEPANCKERSCPTNQLRCNSGRCVPLSWKCDGDHDCADGEDEPTSCSDHNYHTCDPTYFKCDNNRCIPGRWHCDFDNDCGDNSDEVGCKPRNCSESEFRCNNGRCIRGAWHCNGEFNCEDHSDELDCPATCQPNEFQCHSPKFCIYNEWHCDGDTDCADGSDEKGCGLTCKEGEHTCYNGECISNLWVCDSDVDCDDRSDEDPAVCSTLSCRPDQFRCGDGSCIPQSKVCDGIKNCKDHSDEDNGQCTPFNRVCNESQFRCDSGHCISHQFVCDKSDDCGDFSDERDCEEHPCKFGTCSQLCIKKKSGNITCACAAGYTMRSMGKTKSCEAQGSLAYLMIASDGELRSLDPYKPSATQDDILQNSHTETNKIDSIDIYYSAGQTIVFWTDYKSKHIMKHVMKNNAQLTSTSINRSRRVKRQDTEILVSGLNDPRGIAVDWMAQRVYWVDAGDDTISSVALDGTQRFTVLRTHLDQPDDIAVDSESGKIFWTDWGMNAKIEVASLDGSDRKILVDAGVHWPSGITLDVMARRLYWTDPKAGTIETVTVDGKDRHVVKSFGLDEDKPYRIEVFEDDLYVTTYHSNNILKMNKFGLGNITSLVQGLNRATDVVIVHENKHNRNVTSPCSSDVCGEGSFCIHRGAGARYSCVCPDGLLPVNSSSSSSSSTAASTKFSCAGHVIPKVNVCNLICLNGGSCVLETDGSQSCVCKDSYDGERCERYRCSEHCKNRGFCYTDLLTQVIPGQKPPLKCSCPPEWTGDRCEIPANICKTFCKNGAICHIRKGGAGARCSCPPNFTGVHCESCLDHECRNGGTCKRNATTGTPACDCPSSHFGTHCERSECDKYCARGKCAFNADGIPECSCPPGYAGKMCDKDLCQDHCQNGGTCLRNAKKLVCECSPGYSGPRCETNRCQCKNNGTCLPAKNGELVCNCAAGFVGRLCDKFSGVLCPVNNCVNGGTCIVPAEGQTKCHCSTGWIGSLCQEPSGKYNRCHGYCRNGDCSFEDMEQQTPICRCRKGWTGKRCETKDECHLFCLNGGTCNPSVPYSALKPVCYCPHGVEGLRCETAINRPRGSSSNSSNGFIGTIVAVVVLAIIFIALAVSTMFLCRKRSGNPFMHKRMQDSSNVEINNPMYMRGECEDDAAEPMEPAFTIDTDKVTNFTNPVYDSLYSDAGATGVSIEEKKGLLQGESLKVDYYDGHGGSSRGDHPLRDDDRESFA